MSSILPYKNGYRVRIYINGIQHSRVVKNKFLAKEWLKIKELEKLRVESGVDPHPKGTKENLSFKKFAPEYLEWCGRHKAKSTVIGDQISLKQILKFFGNKKLANLSTPDIERYKSTRLEKIATATMARELNCISHMIRIASELGYIKRPPGLKIRRPRVIRSSKIDFYSEEECERLLDSATSPKSKAMILFFLDAGLRRNELVNLQWEDIDLKNNQIFIRSRGPDRHTKNYKDRIIAMTKRLKSAILQLQREDPESVFNISRPKECLKHTFWRAGFKKIGIHKLRHTFATRLLKSKVDLPSVQKLLGHSSILTTMRDTFI